MTFIIGDIHGEITKLKKLIYNILLFDSSASFVFIGDYIDKGENPFETLNYLTDFMESYNCTFLYGNHEYLWLNFFEGDSETEAYLLKYGAMATLHSTASKKISEARTKIVEKFPLLLSSLKAFWKSESYIVVHSGICPDDYLTPIENIPLTNLIFNRYTFLKQEQLYLKKYQVIFGHTGFYTPYVDNYKIGIDTAACFLENQPLTAFCLEQKLFIDSKGDKYSLERITFKSVSKYSQDKTMERLC